MTVGRNDVVPLAASFTFKVPAPLANPTPYSPLRILRGFRPTRPGAHFGVDFLQRTGQPVYAAANATVLTIATDTNRPRNPPKPCNNGTGLILTTYSRGYYIELRHDDSNLTRYIHLVSNSETPRLMPGVPVAAGSQIAKSDNTGSSCGAHLHFSYEVCSAYDSNTIDPVPWLQPNAPSPANYLSNWSVVARLNGIAIESTRQQVTGVTFAYSASLPLASVVGLTSGQSYPLVLSLEDPRRNSVPLFSGLLRIRGNNRRTLQVTWTWGNSESLTCRAADSQGNFAISANFNGQDAARTTIPNSTITHAPPGGFGPVVLTVNGVSSGDTFFFDGLQLNSFGTHTAVDTTATITITLDSTTIYTVTKPVSTFFLQSFPAYTVP
jgi:peptidase M23-like protein